MTDCTFETFEAPENYYDCIALTYVHVPAIKRKDIHINLIKLLKPGGTLILEGFSKAQLDLGTGGPKNLDMLFSKDELFSDFSKLNIKYFNELEIKLSEGNYHNGISSVVQLVAIK